MPNIGFVQQKSSMALLSYDNFNRHHYLFATTQAIAEGYDNTTRIVKTPLFQELTPGPSLIKHRLTRYPECCC